MRAFVEVPAKKVGKCDICKVEKEVFCLKYGFSLCEECIDICATLLEQIEINEQQMKRRRGK